MCDTRLISDGGRPQVLKDNHPNTLYTTMDVDRGYAWVVMMANFGALTVNGGLLFSVGIIITTLQERFDESIAQSALAGSLLTALASFSGPVGSFIISRTSCRVTVMTGAALMTIGFLITAFSTNLTLCIFSCGIMAGLGTGICYSVVYIVNGFHFKDKLNFATGVSMSGGGMGLFLLAPLLEKSKEIYGYPGVFMLAAGVSLQMFLFGSLMRPSVLEMEAKTHRKVKDSFTRNNENDFQLYLKLLRDRATLCLILSFGCFSGGLYTAYMFWPSLSKDNGFSAMQASMFLSISGIVAIAGRLIIGAIASHSLVNVFYIYCMSLTCLGVSCVIFKYSASSMIGQITMSVILGTFSGAPLVIFAGITIKCVGLKCLPATGGLQLLSGGVGSIVIPILCSYFVNNGWSYGDVFTFCGAWLLTGAILIIIARFTDKRLCEDSSRTPMKENELFVK